MLTITESHGFRALVAAVVWIIGRARSLVARIAEPVVRQQAARSNGCWQRIVVAHPDKRSCMCTQGTSALVRHHGTTRWPGRRDLRPRHVLLYGSPYYSLALALAKQAGPGKRSFCRTRTCSQSQAIMSRRVRRAACGPVAVAFGEFPFGIDQSLRFCPATCEFQLPRSVLHSRRRASIQDLTSADLTRSEFYGQGVAAVSHYISLLVLAQQTAR